MPITLDGVDVPVPQNFAPTLMQDAFEASVIAPLTPSEPMPLGDTVIPQYDGGVEAGVVGEGEAKPVSNPSMSHKVISPIKLATIVIVSKEAARLNPARMLDYVQADLRSAITRAVDFGILYGRSAKTGDLIAGASYVNQTTNRVELTAGDLVPQLLAGYDLAGDSVNSDPTGFAFDSRFRTRVALASQQTPGSPASLPNLATSADTVAGLPATYGRVVSGRVGTNADTNVKGFVGDWSKVRWGFGEQITMARSDQATIVDGSNTYHLFQQNLTALLVEAIVGWTVLDENAFAAYEDQV
jgi:HK97 family phage major capsid protein